MKGNKCPACRKYSYFCCEGNYDYEEFGQGATITPDSWHCTQCGFRWSEDWREERSEKKMAQAYIKMNNCEEK